MLLNPELVAPLKSGNLLSRKKPKYVHRAFGNNPGSSGFSRGPWTRLEHWLVHTFSSAALSPLPRVGMIWYYFRFPVSLLKDWFAAAAAVKSRQSCPTLCNPIDSSPPGSAIPGILQAGELEWVALAFSRQMSSDVKMLAISLKC